MAGQQQQAFDYKQFSQSLAQQAASAIPPEIPDHYKNILVQVIADFAMKAGEALVNEEDSMLNAQQIQLIIQYIAEWTFHKGIELMNSQIPPDHWLRILQTIAGGIFESGKKAMIGGLDQDTVTSIIQGEVESHYTHVLNLLKNEGAVTDEQIMSVRAPKQQVSEQAPPQQAPAQTQQQIAQQAPHSVGAKEAKLATIAVILSTLPEEKVKVILESFTREEAEIIRHFMKPENMTIQIDPQMTVQLLASLKNTIMPENAPTLVAKNIQKLSESVDQTSIINILIKERPMVQNYVKACIEGKFIRRDFSPHLAKVIFKYLNKQLNPA